MPEPLALVTGLGVVTARARDSEVFWAARAVAPPPGVASALDGALLRHPRRFGDLVTRASLDAVAQAWHAAGLPADGLDDTVPGPHRTAPARAGCQWGVGLAGLRAAERASAAVAAGRDPAPRDVLALSPAEPVAAVARRLGLSGPCRAIATACASATDAIADAARLIASGACDIVVAGGAEAGATPVNLAGLARLGLLSATGTARPFDDGRDGLVLAEAAAALVLESPGHARARGARPLAAVLGSASGRDLDAGVAAPGVTGLAVSDVATRALAAAGLRPADLTAVLGHAAGTAVGDAAEAAGLARLLTGVDVPVTAGKGATGHAMAASGALAAAEAVLALERGHLLPVVGLRARPERSAAADLDLVTQRRVLAPGPVVSVSAGFGGFISALVIAPV
ncbi:MAG: beta-ketoacyl synthase N-terminal-like domain-containing protein [Kineosporiaceae bacterium]